MPIYDQSFRRYAGVRHHRMLWWPVARETLKPILKSKLTYLLGMAVLVPVIIVSVQFFIAAKFRDIAGNDADVAAKMVGVSDVPIFGNNISLNTFLYKFLEMEFAFLWLVVVAHGGGAISVEKKNNALPLYFSRPLAVWDYAFGKIAGLAVLPMLLLAAAIVLIFIQASAYFYTRVEVFAQLPLLFSSLGYVFVMCSLVALSMAAFSSMTKTARAAAVLFFAFWFLTATFARILRETTDNRAFAAISPMRALNTIASVLLDPELRWMKNDPDYITFALPLAIVSVGAYSLLFLFLLRRNLKVVEVVK